MRVTNGEVVYEIEDKEASYSAYLEGALNLERSGNESMLDTIDGALYIESSRSVLENFVRFLKGDDNIVMEIEDEEFFSFMGIPNEEGYPLSYWRVKVRDDWIKKNSSRLDPYYDLTRIEITEALGIEYFIPRDIIGKNFIVGGEVGLFLTEEVSKDIVVDVFPLVNLRSINKVVEDLGGSLVTSYIDLDGYLRTSNEAGPMGLYDTRIKLKKYESPSEVAHSYDVDCLGFAYDGKYLYATSLTLYAIKNRVNWFDSRHYSTSYVMRLLELQKEGYNIMLPSFDPSKINSNLITDDVDKILKIYLSCGRDCIRTPEMINTKYMADLIHTVGSIGSVTNRISQGDIEESLNTLHNIKDEEVTVGGALGASGELVTAGIISAIPNRDNWLDISSTITYLSYVDYPEEEGGYIYRDEDDNEEFLSDKKALIEEGFTSFLKISNLDNLSPDDLPFVRDRLSVWYKQGMTQGDILSHIISDLHEMNKTYHTRGRIGERHSSLLGGGVVPKDNASLLILAFAYGIVVLNERDVPPSGVTMSQILSYRDESSSIIRAEDLYESSKYYNKKYERNLLKSLYA